MLRRRPRAHRAGHGPLGLERPIEQAQAVEQAAVGVRVAAVEGVTVVEIDHELECALGRRRPFEKRLAPGHAQVVVQLAVDEKRALRRIPERIAGGRACQALPRVVRAAFVGAVCVEGLARPCG